MGLQKKNGPVRSITVHQYTGDVIFVPSGWYHQVHNERDTISINHNWFNAANILTILKNLNTELNRVEAEITDCRADPDWNMPCQNLLREHHGMNHVDLLDILNVIMKRRISQNSLDVFESRTINNTLQEIKKIFLERNIEASLEACNLLEEKTKLHSKKVFA